MRRPRTGNSAVTTPRRSSSASIRHGRENISTFILFAGPKLLSKTIRAALQRRNKTTGRENYFTSIPRAGLSPQQLEYKGRFSLTLPKSFPHEVEGRRCRAGACSLLSKTHHTVPALKHKSPPREIFSNARSSLAAGTVDLRNVPGSSRWPYGQNSFRGSPEPHLRACAPGSAL